MLSRASKKRFSGGRLPPKPTRRYSVSGGTLVPELNHHDGDHGGHRHRHPKNLLGHAMPIIGMRVAIQRAPQALTIA